jgi:hypothetical protein
VNGGEGVIVGDGEGGSLAALTVESQVVAASEDGGSEVRAAEPDGSGLGGAVAATKNEALDFVAAIRVGGERDERGELAVDWLGTVGLAMVALDGDELEQSAGSRVLIFAGVISSELGGAGIVDGHTVFIGGAVTRDGELEAVLAEGVGEERSGRGVSGAQGSDSKCRGSREEVERPRILELLSTRRRAIEVHVHRVILVGV